MCSPCGPMICYKYEDCGPPKGRSSDATPQEESSNEKKNDKENQLKRTKSRELRGGIMYYSCHCIKRNGLQHDCRRTGCGGEPSCLVLPDPLCAPSQLARARGLADPAPLAAHYRAQGGGAGPSNDSSGAAGGGKRFIVCELKGIVPDSQADKTTKCCKCPPLANNSKVQTIGSKDCHCNSSSQGPNMSSMFVFDEKTLESIMSKFNNKEVASSKEKVVIGPGGRPRKSKVEAPKEICTRPGCVHWKPPPPCVWDAPCKADCFEAPPGIQPGRNPLTGGGGPNAGPYKSGEKVKILTLIQ
ncbi:uncharacterized protein LOC123716652 isoform X2 [Pieris brassicae]|uniref:uncharacterized protein LOC123716652 isoform X2 n=1 Tax=Pieris brassicae TaxID=7116 RepID=UPI001E660976|nr:uncharacterized protein LOC123716652 isoform X2 [Pieris brassicae]